MFTQAVVVLTSRPVSLEELFPLLPEYPVLGISEGSDEWALGGRTAMMHYRKEVKGTMAIDSIDRPWPDHMGDSKLQTMLFGAWATGHFGPFTYPGGLGRATEQAWSWSDAAPVVAKHQAFVRLRLSYTIGTGPDAKVLPPDYDPCHELEFLVDVARCLLKHPAALCYFNPSGEKLLAAGALSRTVEHDREHQIPALDVWTNVRLFNLTPEWTLMDTVGNWQLDMPDHEAVFPKGKFNARDVDHFLFNAALYVLKHGSDKIKDNDTMDGPGSVRWRACRFTDSLASPPREVFSWIPVGTEGIPAKVTERKRARQAPQAPVEEKKRWWQFWRR